MDNIDISIGESFRTFIWDFYKNNKRAFSWRTTQDSYAIVVSEVMLQQTQTQRVEHKYEQFIAAFPSFEALAQASFHAVLAVWQGMGYNRRGKYLYEIACKVMHEYGGILPDSPELLVTFPGIGPATASSICAFAFNKPTVFIETNIRAVFIHTFFPERIDIHDKELLPLIAATVDQQNPREWYYALMDYGVFLKKTIVNPSRKSKHYTVQSRFEGSDRQIRGAIIRLLVNHHMVHRLSLPELVDADPVRVNMIVEHLIKERFVTGDINTIRINDLQRVQLSMPLLGVQEKKSIHTY